MRNLATHRPRVSEYEAEELRKIARSLILEGKRLKEVAHELNRSDSYIGHIITRHLDLKRVILTDEECALIQAHRAKQGITFTP
jgi:hypothetical protein